MTTLLDFYKQKNTKQVKAEEQEKLKQKKSDSLTVLDVDFLFGLESRLDLVDLTVIEAVVRFGKLMLQFIPENSLVWLWWCGGWGCVCLYACGTIVKRLVLTYLVTGGGGGWGVNTANGCHTEYANDEHDELV